MQWTLFCITWQWNDRVFFHKRHTTYWGSNNASVFLADGGYTLPHRFPWIMFKTINILQYFHSVNKTRRNDKAILGHACHFQRKSHYYLENIYSPGSKSMCKRTPSILGHPSGLYTQWQMSFWVRQREMWQGQKRKRDVKMKADCKEEATRQGIPRNARAATKHRERQGSDAPLHFLEGVQPCPAAFCPELSGNLSQQHQETSTLPLPQNTTHTPAYQIKAWKSPFFKFRIKEVSKITSESVSTRAPN